MIVFGRHVPFYFILFLKFYIKDIVYLIFFFLFLFVSIYLSNMNICYIILSSKGQVL